MSGKYFVIDTNAFIWYLTASPKLSKKALGVLDLVDEGKAVAVIPAIVLLEAIDIFDKKKASGRFEDLVLKVSRSDNFVLAELDWGLILEVNRTKGLKDLHDRIIVAAAKIFDAGLLTRDRELHSFYPKCIW